ncbi:MAG: OB-fold nucleic acid binding domain-containing protein [Methanobacteriaceae archaeon]|jgi:DNA/RNA endonuclease YhcR with UshA esterase domain
MNDKHIFQIALVTAVFGLAGMIFLSGEIVPMEFRIKEINRNHIGEDLAIQGLVRTVRKPGNLYILSVIDETGEINVVIFDPLADEFKREGINPRNFENRRVKIVGRVNEYKGSIQLIVENTRSIKIV